MSYSGIRTSSSSTGMEGTWTSTFAAAAVPEASVGWSRMLEPTSRAFHSQSSRWTAHNTSASWWCRNLISSYNAMSMSTVNLHSMLPQSRRAEYAGRPWVRRVSKSLWMLSIKRVKSQRCQVTCFTEQLAKNAIYHLCQYQHSNVTCSPLIKNIANFFFPLAHCSDYWHSTPHIFNTPSHTHTHTHTHTHPFNGPFSGTNQVSWYQKGKTTLDFTEARDSEWQWNQLGHMHVCTLLQTDNHASTRPFCFYRPDALPATQPTASKHWRHINTPSQFDNKLHCRLHPETTIINIITYRTIRRGNCQHGLLWD